MKTILQSILVAGAALLTIGWDYPLSEEALAEINWETTYREVKEDPEAYRGKTLLLGGRIVEHIADREGSRLEILCYELDRRDRPTELDPECGRFLAITIDVLDSERYRQGRLVTLTGTVRGQTTLPLGGESYSYLTFEVGDIHLWPLPSQRSPFYYHDPFYDPFCHPFRSRFHPYRYRDPFCW